MAQSTISQRIALEGAEDILRQLADLGLTGEKAVKQIQDATGTAGPALNTLSGIATTVRGAFSQIGETVAPIGARFHELSEAAREVGSRLTEVASIFGVGLAAGIAGGIAGIFELIKSSAEAGHQLEIQAATIGLTVEQLQAYRRVALDAGVDGDRVFTALVKLTQNLGKETTKLSQDTIKVFAALPAAISAAGAGVLRGSALPEAGTNRGISGISPEAIAAVNQFTDQFAKAAEAEGKVLSVADIERYRQSVIKLTGDVTAVGENFRLAAAAAGVPFPALTQGEELKRNAEIAADPVLRLGVTLKDLQTNGENLDPVIRKIFDGLAAVPDTATKNSIALALLGRGAKELTEAFAGGSGSLDDALAKIRASGLGLTPEQAGLLAEAEKELNRLTVAGAGLRNQLALIFAPAVIAATETFIELIKGNADALKSFAQTIASEIIPGVKNLISQFSGAGEAAGGSGADNLLSKFQAIRDTVGTVRDTVVTVFTAIKSVLETVATAVNAVFPTNFNAAGLAAVIIVGQLTGAFTLLLPLLGLATALIAALATPVGLVTAAIAGVIIAIVNWRSTLAALQGAASAVAQGLSTTFTAALGGISALFGTISATIQSLAASLSNVLTPIFGAITAGLNAAVSGIAGALSGIVNAISQPFVQAITLVENAFSGLVDWVAGTAKAIVGVLQPVLEFISNLTSKLGSILGVGGGAGGGSAIGSSDSPGLGVDSGGGDFSSAMDAGAPGLATGGHITNGPSGIDRIPAMLSLNEFVISAAAVRRYGANLFHAFNSMSLPIRGFNLGGIVDAIGERFAPMPLMLAGGGPVLSASGGPMNSLTLHLDGHSFSMAVKPGEVFDKLSRHARSSAIRSAGRKPSWAT